MSPARDVVVAMASDRGRAHRRNGDRIRVVRSTGRDDRQHGLLAIVCDGHGEGSRGASAKRLVTRVARRAFPEGEDPGATLAATIDGADCVPYRPAPSRATLVGTTASCTALLLRGGLAWCAHRGNSRCFLVRAHELYTMTRDHASDLSPPRPGSSAASATRWPRPFVIQAGDRLLLETDGLHGAVPEAEIVRVVDHQAPREACRELIRLARAAGGIDDVSVILLGVPGTACR